MKTIFEEYGIVIVVAIVIVALIATALLIAPGDDDGWMGKSLQSLTTAFNEKEEDAQQEYNHDAPELHLSGILPAGATYKRFTNGIFDAPTTTWTYDELITYNAGDAFPECVEGDIYRFGDYEYCYGWYWCVDCERWSHFCGCEYSIDNWAVRVIDKTKSKYGVIFESINNKPVTHLFNTFGGCVALTEAPVIPRGIVAMTCAFEDCASLTKAPNIPENVKDIRYTFRNCSALTKAPVIPANVNDILGTFKGCSALAGSITINATPDWYTDCLRETQVTEILGSCGNKDAILATK